MNDDVQYSLILYHYKTPKYTLVVVDSSSSNSCKHENNMTHFSLYAVSPEIDLPLI